MFFQLYLPLRFFFPVAPSLVSCFLLISRCLFNFPLLPDGAGLVNSVRPISIIFLDKFSCHLSLSIDSLIHFYGLNWLRLPKAELLLIFYSYHTWITRGHRIACELTIWRGDLMYFLFIYSFLIQERIINSIWKNYIRIKNIINLYQLENYRKFISRILQERLWIFTSASERVKHFYLFIFLLQNS